MAEQLTSGIKIAVDTSEIDVKFLKSAEALNASLTKTQKSLGLTYNEQGLLTNALGQCVEGLSAAQIRMGEYVDGLGTVHTYQGGLVEGLNKSQIAMGMYSDELGNVYDKTGALVGQTAAAAKALEKEAADAAKRAAQSMKELAESAREASAEVQNTSDAFKDIAAPLESFGDLLKAAGMGEAGEKVKDLWEKYDELKKRFENVGDTLEFIKDVPNKLNNIDLKKLKQWAVDLGGGFKNVGKQAVTMGKTFASVGKAAWAAMTPLGPIILGVGAAIAAAFAVKKIIDHFHPVEELSDRYKELEEQAKKTGKEIKNANDVLKAGVFAEQKDNSLAAAAKELEEKTKAYKDAQDKMDETRKRAGAAAMTGAVGLAYGAGAMYAGSLDVKNAENQMKNQAAVVNDLLAPIMEDARANAKTQAEKLAEQVADLDRAILLAEQAEASEADRAALAKRRAEIEKKRAEAEEAEWAESKGLADIMSEAEAAVKAARPYQDEAAQLQADLDARLAEGKLSQEKYNEASRILAEKAQAAAAKEIGIDAPQMPPIPPELKPQMDAITEQFKNGALSLDQLNEATQKARDEYEAAKIGDALQKSAAMLENGEISAEQHAANMAAAAKQSAELAKKRGGIGAALDKYREEIALGHIDQASANEEIKALQKEQAEALKKAGASASDWAEAARDGRVAQEDAAEALKAIRDEARSKLAEELGVEIAKPKKELGYAESVQKLREALTKGTIDQEEYNATLEALNESEKEKLAKETGATFEKKDERDPLTKYADAAAKLEKALEEGRLSQEDYNAGIESLKETARAAQPGLEALLNQKEEEDPVTKAEKEYADIMNQIAAAEEQGLYDAQQVAKMKENAEKNLAAAYDESAKKEREKLDKMRGELGIDKLLEDMKSPLDKYRETMDKIAEAAGEGAISSDEAALLQAKAEDDYWTKMGDVADKSKEKLDKVTLGQSMTSGSSALYSAMAKMSAGNYQNKIQSATEKLADTQAAALAEQRQTNFYLSGMGGDVPTFAGR